MDVPMPVLDGVAVLREVPGRQVLMLTTFDDEEDEKYVVKAPSNW